VSRLLVGQPTLRRTMKLAGPGCRIVSADI
jgi:hypothetical protein